MSRKNSPKRGRNDAQNRAFVAFCGRFGIHFARRSCAAPFLENFARNGALMMNKFQDLKLSDEAKRKYRTIHNRRTIRISDGCDYARVDAYMLSELACVSLKHAYRIISGEARMTPTIERLLQVLLLGTVPGWPPGWRFRDDRLWSPRGIGFYPTEVENTGLERQLHEHTQRDNERLQAEVNRLRKLLAAPRELRVYHNDEAKPRRVLRIGEGKHRTA